MSKTLDLPRAKDSLEKVESILGNQAFGEEWRDKYAGYVESLPATILNCGLGQATATLLAAAKKSDGSFNKDAHYLLYKHLQSWLCQDIDNAPYNSSKNLMEAIVASDRSTYLHAQAEALKWLEWHKKLAVAYLKKKKAGDPA